MNITFKSNGIEFVPMLYDTSKRVYVLRHRVPLHEPHDITTIPDFITPDKDVMDSAVRTTMILEPDGDYDVRLEWLQ